MKILHVRMCVPHSVSLVLADVIIVGAKVKHHGTPRFLGSHFADAVGIVADRAFGFEPSLLTTRC